MQISSPIWFIIGIGMTFGVMAAAAAGVIGADDKDTLLQMIGTAVTGAIAGVGLSRVKAS